MKNALDTAKNSTKKKNLNYVTLNDLFKKYFMEDNHVGFF